jgi:hypothetical protein
MLYPLEFATLVKIVLGIVMGWYAREFYYFLKRHLDARAARAHEELMEERRIEILRLIDAAILQEDLAFKLAERLIELGRKRKNGFGMDQRWDLMRGMRNHINEYSGLCGRIERLAGDDYDWQVMCNRRRNKLDPFERAESPTPEQKAAPA